VRAAPEIAVTSEQLDRFCDKRGRVRELIPVVSDDPGRYVCGRVFELVARFTAVREDDAIR
jgi:hypothetical protein